ncbi:unnamed protein product [Macrosiphum euphorbiae]|uniref:Uncharacterized protein n=1 Tax=Macrosiphum euphorbiae TaxID=13131 RepID=A0AAV0WMA9_9HEMI|nr:unnamed protein product [Macrosiphum euphorbiae]
MRYSSLYMARHNSLVARIKKAAAVKKGTTTLIIDATVPFDNRLEAFKVAAAEKVTKYEELRRELAESSVGDVTVVPLIVGALGSWDPGNDDLVKRICSRSYRSLLRKLCVSEVVSFTRDIYTEHISGVRARHG